MRKLLLLIFFLFITTSCLSNDRSLKSEVSTKKEKTTIKKSEVEEVGESASYELRSGEEFVDKTSNNKTLTKYNGAYYVDGIMIVNKSYPVEQTYLPLNPYKEVTLSVSQGQEYLDKEAYEAFLKMKEDASRLNYNLYISSGYRSYNYQLKLYSNYVARDGVELADTYSARAGFSEHQSGLCFDLNGVNENFLETEIGKWVYENSYKYGFILRYPKGKEDITGYQFEAWHYRYVGSIASTLYNNGDYITLEEYLGVDSKY